MIYILQTLYTYIQKMVNGTDAQKKNQNQK